MFTISESARTLPWHRIVVITSCIFCRASSRWGVRSFSAVDWTKGHDSPSISCSRPSLSSVRRSDFGYALTSHRDVNESSNARKQHGTLFVITIVVPRTSREERREVHPRFCRVPFRRNPLLMPRNRTRKSVGTVNVAVAVAHRLTLSSRLRRITNPSSSYRHVLISVEEREIEKARKVYCAQRRFCRTEWDAKWHMGDLGREESPLCYAGSCLPRNSFAPRGIGSLLASPSPSSSSSSSSSSSLSS